MNIKMRIIVICCGIILGLYPLFPASHSIAQSRLEVTKDRDKTVYSIESNKQGVQEENEDKDKAWEMLKNSGIIIDKQKAAATQGNSTISQESK